MTLPFRTHLFLALVGFMAFTLVFVSVGIRWHTYAATAAMYAREEMEHTFEAADYARAAQDRGDTPESEARALECRRLARYHQQLAAKNAKLRELYQRSW